MDPRKERERNTRAAPPVQVKRRCSSGGSRRVPIQISMAQVTDRQITHTYTHAQSPRESRTITESVTKALAAQRQAEARTLDEPKFSPPEVNNPLSPWLHDSGFLFSVEQTTF